MTEQGVESIYYIIPKDIRELRPEIDFILST